MDYDAQLKLQAFLDGELPEKEADKVANWLAQEKEATALLAELRNTRKAMVGLEIGVRLPESREFFWSKIEREIQCLERPVPQPVRVPLFTLFRRLLIPAAAIAVLVIAGIIAIPSARPGPETTLADSGAFTYHDYSAGATLVWLSYPAENDVAQDDEVGTID